MRQSRKVMWDMINTLFLTLYLFLLLSFNNCKHKSMDSSAILANIFEEQRAKNHPQYLSELPHVLFPTTFLEIAVVKLQTIRKAILGQPVCVKVKMPVYLLKTGFMVPV